METGFQRPGSKKNVPGLFGNPCPYHAQAALKIRVHLAYVISQLLWGISASLSAVCSWFKTLYYMGTTTKSSLRSHRDASLISKIENSPTKSSSNVISDGRREGQIRLQVQNKEEMAWQHRSGANPTPCGSCTRHEPDPFVTLWRYYSIKAPRRTSECKSGAQLQGLNCLEQMQHLAFEPGTHPENACKDSKAVGKKLPLDLAARVMLCKPALCKPAAFLYHYCSSFCRGERFLQALMVGRNLQGQTVRPHPVC